MPIKEIPLAGNPTARGWSTTTPYSKDQIFKGVVSQFVHNPVTNSASYFLQKRVGLSVDTAAIAAAVGTSLILSQPYSFSAALNVKIVCLGENLSTVYHSLNTFNTNCGSTSDGGTDFVVRHTTEVEFNSVKYLLFSAVRATAGIPVATSGWYVASDAVAASNTFTGDRTSGSAVVSNVSSTAGLHPGQLISATGFAAGTRILTVDSATQVTMNATASSGAPTGTTFTREDIAKIASNFPANITGAFQELDGRVYIMTQGGLVYGSNINNLDLWTTDGFFPCDVYTDIGIGLGKWKSYLLAFGLESCEFLYNAGNSAGSQLSRQKAMTMNIGARISNISPFKALIGSAFDTVAWVTNDMLPKVYLWTGELKDISSSDISTVLSGWTSFTRWNLGMFSGMGQHFVYISAVSTGPSYINQTYSVESKIWADQNYTDAYVLDEGINATGLAVETTLTTGNLYLQNGAVFQDNGVNFTCLMQLAPLVLNGGKAFTINRMDLIADTQSSGNTSVSLSGNDYASFSTAKNFDMTQQSKRLFRLGFFEHHAIIKLEHAANTAGRWQSLVIDWEPATT